LRIKQEQLFSYNSDKQIHETDVEDLSATVKNYGQFTHDGFKSLDTLREMNDRKRIIKKARGFKNSIGLLRRIIDLKVDFISSDIKITHDNEDVEEYFTEIYEDLNIYSFIRSAAEELIMNDEFYMFKSFNKNDPINVTTLDPLRVDVKNVLGESLVYLRPTVEMQNMLNSSIEEERRMAQKLIPPKIQEQWIRGKEALLNSELTGRYCINRQGYQKYPDNPIQPIFKDLKLLETLIASDYANAKNLKSILHAKVGDKDVNKGVMPKEAIENVERLLDEPNSSALELVTQFFVNLEFVNTDPETFTEEKYQAVTRRILNWSNINVFLSDGESYGSGFIKIKSLRREIENKRRLIKKALDDFNKQIAEKQDFITYGGKPKIPKITFKDTMKDDKLTFEITRWLHQQGLISIEDTLEEFDYMFEDMKKKKEKEIEKYGDQEDNIWRPVFESSQGIVSDASGAEEAADNGGDSDSSPVENDEPRR